MAVLNLPFRAPKVARPKLITVSPPVKPRKPHDRAAKLAEVEERLLADAIAAHPSCERAVSHLLSDLEKPGRASTGANARLTQVPHHAQVERIEDLLLEAIVRTHPNRGRAIDRLLGDVVGDAAMDDADALADHHAAAEMSFDNDFDGLG